MAATDAELVIATEALQLATLTLKGLLRGCECRWLSQGMGARGKTEGKIVPTKPSEKRTKP